MLLKHRKRYSLTSRKARVFKAPSRRSYKIRCRRNFFSTSHLTQERRKVSTNELPTRRVKDSPSSFFVLRVAQFKKAKDFLYDKLPTRAMEVRKSQGSHCPLGLVYRHKKRAWESWEKERKRPRKARRWLQRRQRSVCPKPRIPFFLFTSIWVQKWPILVEVSAPTRLGLQGSHVRRQYQKRTP